MSPGAGGENCARCRAKGGPEEKGAAGREAPRILPAREGEGEEVT